MPGPAQVDSSRRIERIDLVTGKAQDSHDKRYIWTYEKHRALDVPPGEDPAKVSLIMLDGFRVFQFPPPENVIFGEPLRLATQGSLPSTELVERAGFTGITETPDPFGPRHVPFDDDQGQPLPAPDEAGFYNYPVQAAVDARFNAIPAYLEQFGAVFNASGPLPAGGITISTRRRAVAEFQTCLIAPPSHPPGHGRSALHA